MRVSLCWASLLNDAYLSIPLWFASRPARDVSQDGYFALCGASGRFPEKRGGAGVDLKTAKINFDAIPFTTVLHKKLFKV
jgi:hypothetical protein